jgi:hypothetical protein
MVQRASEASRRVAWTRERERLATELRYLTRRHDWNPTPEIVEAVVEWHIEAIAAARLDAWIPGMAGSRDPIVNEVLSRFHAHRMGTAVARLIDMNSELKQQLLHAVECIRFYAGGPSDDGSRAREALGPLLATEPQDEEDAGVIPSFLVTWSHGASQMAE